MSLALVYAALMSSNMRPLALADLTQREEPWIPLERARPAAGTDRWAYLVELWGSRAIYLLFLVAPPLLSIGSLVFFVAGDASLALAALVGVFAVVNVVVGLAAVRSFRTVLATTPS